MQPLGLNEIREEFLKFFEKKDHLRLKSFPLVPINDKSLLLINSGMAPMKPYFTGDEVPPRSRVTTCQKCIRTPDIENVGKTARHGTFFEMLGNFSFGDYFKEEIIPWSWEFCIDVMKMPADKIYVTIYLDDDEAYDIWHDTVGVPDDHIVRLGKEDNFWEHGTGPCGPCSELHFDRGEKYGCGKPDCGPGCECDRYVEFWNLVFSQYNRDEAGNYTPLVQKNIDTGMGLERLATIMQEVDNIFEVDTIRHILEYTCKKAKVTYGKNDKDDVSIRVITDHVRSVTFMIADGVMPSNEGRGYVLRRLLRRAARHGKLLGIDDLFLYDVAKEVIKVSSGAYPELAEKQAYIQKLIKIEEERFKETLDQGLSLLNGKLEDIIKEEKKVFPGFGAFKLYDTYGFPFELTKEIIEEKGLTVSVHEFEQAMKEQRERARKARAETNAAVWADDPFNPLGKEAISKFTGYETLEDQGKIIGLIAEDTLTQTVYEGQEVLMLLDQTPFYAESGGQIGDKGVIVTDDAYVEINDCKKGSLGRHIHYGKVTKGQLKVGQVVTAKVDKKLRAATQRNHSCTHLLQKSLKAVLGDHVEQAGSFVSPKRLRFDFNHYQAMTQSEILEVEKRVNEAILEAHEITTFETNIDEARKLGAMALFGEKYGEIVRVVKMGDYSIELCGGTHLSNTAQVGMFKIVSETGVAAGIRRIEATTGLNTFEYMLTFEKAINETAKTLKTTPKQIVEKAEELIELSKQKDKIISEMKTVAAKSQLTDIENNKIVINNVDTIIAEVKEVDLEEMRKMADLMKEQLQSGIVLLGVRDTNKVNFIATATKDVVKKGFHAGKLIKEVAAITGGGGGGRPDMAQAGGKKPEKLGEALDKAKDFIQNQIN